MRSPSFRTPKGFALAVITLFFFLQSCSSPRTYPNYCETEISTSPDWIHNLGQETLSFVGEALVLEQESDTAASPENKTFPTKQLKQPLCALDSCTDPITTEATQDALQQVESHAGPEFSLVINNHTFPLPDSEVDSSEPLKLSRIESLYYYADGLSRGSPLAQYGYDILSNREPVDGATPVSRDYILGPGDEILVQASGPVSISETISLDRNGLFFLPEFGGIDARGMRLADLQHAVYTLVSTQYRDVDLNVALGASKGIRILVLGQAVKPGIVEVPSTADILDALAAAGGIKKDGSLRKIELRRANGELILIDLYQLFIDGSTRSRPIIQADDQIRIPAIGATAAIIGPLGSGIYEIDELTTLETMVNYQGGLNAFTYKDQILLERTIDHSRREICRIDYDSSSSNRIHDGDVVQLANVIGDLNRSVCLSGEVVRPGLFPFEEGMRVSDLLERGQGFMLGASLDRALIERRVGASGVFDLIPGDGRGSCQEAVIWLDMAAIINGDESANIELQRLDTLKILSVAQTQEQGVVSIDGAVRRPGTYKLSANMTLSDLVNLAEGPSDSAFDGISYIMRRSLQKNHHYDVSLYPFCLQEVLKGGDQGHIRLHNHDRILIREMQALQKTVKIEGMVQFPGTYTLPEGSRISDLIAAAGGVLPGADMRAAIFSRERVSAHQIDRLSHLVSSSRRRSSRTRDLVTRDGRVNESVANHLHLLGLEHLAIDMDTFQTQGRIVLDFMDPDFIDSSHNLALESGDSLAIPQRLESVIVIGHVFSPNAFMWSGSKSVGDYLCQAGGTLEDADLSQVYAILASGEVISAAQIGCDALYETHLGPGDSILVPSKPLGRSKNAMWCDSLAILRSLAEIGLIGSAIPHAGDNNAVGLDMGTSPQPIPTAVGRPYDEILADERILIETR